MATVAGLCWIGHYALQVGYGLATGKALFNAEFDTGGTPFFRLDMALFFGAYLATGLALIVFAAGLPVNRWLKYAGIAFAFVGALAGFAGLLFGGLFPGSVSAVASAAGKGILAHFVAALLVGFGAWRASDMPTRRAARCIALFGLLTMPLAMLFGMLEKTVPSYFVTEVHFVFSGALWLAAARAMAKHSEAASSPVLAAQTGAESV